MLKIRDDLHFYQTMIEALSVSSVLSNFYNFIYLDYSNYYEEVKDGSIYLKDFKCSSHLPIILDKSIIAFRNIYALFDYISNINKSISHKSLPTKFKHLSFHYSPFFNDPDNSIYLDSNVTIFVLNDFMMEKTKSCSSQLFAHYMSLVLSLLEGWYNDIAAILYVAKFMTDYTNSINFSDNSFVPMNWEFEDLQKFPNSEVAFSYVNLAISDALLLTKDTN